MIIHPADLVDVHLDDGQKYAIRPIKKGEVVVKYGFPIGEATCDIAEGELVSSHNLHSLLSGLCEWQYQPKENAPVAQRESIFWGYLRPDGRVGTRNELWIIPTVGCINGVARELARRTGAKALTHPYGCSQLGEDLATTRDTLAALIRHPNAGGVLVLGLGCENNHIEGIKQAVANQGGAYDESRIRYLSLQDCEDEIEEGLTQLAELAARMATDARTEVPISKLKVGVKCGGSDGYSGITANPLIGSVSDMLALWGASILMTELPEAFGAEEILLARASSQAVFDAAAEMLTDFRRYYIAHGEKISENPSPGNIAGGITTLEEKALGCVQKAGQVPLCGVAKIGETATAQGLTLVDGPGNDLVAITHLMAAGANVILFSTGRGTPLSAPIPTIKISTNSALAKKKAHWIDFDAGACLMVDDTELYRKSLFIHTLGVASGTPTRAEENGYYDIALFKRGVTL